MLYNKNFANYILWRLQKSPVSLVKLDISEGQIIIGDKANGSETITPLSATANKDLKLVKALVKTEKLNNNKPEIYKALKLAKQIMPKSTGHVYFTAYNEQDFVTLRFVHLAGKPFEIRVYSNCFDIRYAYDEQLSYIRVEAYEEIFFYFSLITNKEEFVSFYNFKKQIDAVLDNMTVGSFTIMPTSFYAYPRHIVGTDAKQTFISFGVDNNAFITTNRCNPKVLRDSQINKAFSELKLLFKEQNENKAVFLKNLPLLKTLINNYKFLIGRVKVSFPNKEYNKNNSIFITIYPSVNDDSGDIVLEYDANGVVPPEKAELPLPQELFNAHFELYKKGATK